MLPASRSKECPRMIHWLPRVKTVSNPVKIVWGSNQILKVCQSQRDCFPKPRVARNELPWGNGSERQNPNGVSALVNVHRRSQPRWGCYFARLLPRVDRSSQPWALLRNPVGIHGKFTLPKPGLRTPRMQLPQAACGCGTLEFSNETLTFNPLTFALGSAALKIRLIRSL